MIGPNRITDKVRDLQKRLETVEVSANLEEAGSLEFRDWYALGDKASLAVAHGLISLEEGNALHAIHGETLEHFQRQSLAHRLTYVLCAAELVAALRTGSSHGA